MFNRVFVESEGHTPFYASLGKEFVLLNSFSTEDIDPSPEDLIVFSGGVDINPELYGEERHPATQSPNRRRDELCVKLWELSRKNNVPTLGICRGHQFIAAMKGVSLIQHLPGGGEHGFRRDVQFEGKFWAKVPKCHHQAVPITKKLNILAKTDRNDGISFIEAFETEHNVLGVQGHPEWCDDPNDEFPTWVRNKLWSMKNV